MIHSLSAMPTGNLDDPNSLQTSEEPRLPSRYYSSYATDVQRLFPRWMVLGCGGLAGLFLVVLFAGSLFVTSSGFGEAFDLMLSMMQSEAARYYAADVPKEARDRFDAELSAVRKDVKGGQLSPAKLDPLLQQLKTASEDKLLRMEEVEQLTKTAHEIRTSGKKK
jgi:hypothetical protein